MSVEVRGAGRFHAVARKLRTAANRKDLVREMRKGILDATPELKQAVRDRASEFLPNRYAAVLNSSMRMTTVTSVAGDQVTVRMTVTARGKSEARKVGDVEAGVLKHKTYGHDPWVAQAVKPGFVSEPMSDKAPAVRKQIEAAVDRTLNKIAGG